MLKLDCRYGKRNEGMSGAFMNRILQVRMRRRVNVFEMHEIASGDMDKAYCLPKSSRSLQRWQRVYVSIRQEGKTTKSVERNAEYVTRD